jgi:hypothetical protein
LVVQSLFSRSLGASEISKVRKSNLHNQASSTENIYTYAETFFVLFHASFCPVRLNSINYYGRTMRCQAKGQWNEQEEPEAHKARDRTKHQPCSNGTRHEQEEHEAHTPPRWSHGSSLGRVARRHRCPVDRGVGHPRMPKKQKEVLATAGGIRSRADDVMASVTLARLSLHGDMESMSGSDDRWRRDDEQKANGGARAPAGQVRREAGVGSAREGDGEECVRDSFFLF